MINFIKKKIDRLKVSKRYFKILLLYNKIFGEKDLGKMGFDFSKKHSRIFIVQNIIDKKNYKSYLEIGTFKDELFSNISCETKIGVDPVSGGTNRETSDDFFLNNKKKFDCIFIDGLHHYDQVKKDIINSLEVLNDDGIILMHDCLPNDVYAQVVPRCTIDWNGDVWKAFVECRTKNNLDCYTCNADHGIGVIFKRDNKNILNLEKDNFLKLTFKEYFNNNKEFMNIIEYEDLLKII